MSHNARIRGKRVRRRGRLLALVLALAVAAAGILLVPGLLGSAAEDELEAFVAALESGDDRGAGARTDDPEAAARALSASREGLDGAEVRGEIVSFEEEGGRAEAELRLTWEVPGLGPWSYASRPTLAQQGDDWKVEWAPELVHPGLERGTRLGTIREFEPRAPILDRDGDELVTERAVVRVGAIAGEVDDPATTANGLASLFDLDRGRLRRSIRQGGEEQFVEAIVLRVADYREVEPELEAIPDTTTIADEVPLAPSREFARALLGTVGPITAEQRERLGKGYPVGASVGQWGLQAAFERRLAGDPEIRIVIRGEDGAPLETLHTRPARAGEPLRTTLDRRLQDAAEDALGERRANAALVALQPSSGDILVVANRPVESTFNRAMEGRYAPGSTFKVITTAALLREGLDPGETVPCPRSVSVEGRPFRNFEGTARGDVPFREDFTESCNTAFVSLEDRLGDEALETTASDFGFGRSLELPLRAFGGEVPPADNRVEKAAAMIGQHEVLASPLGMAGVAATVAEGRWRAPRLVSDDPAEAGDPLDPEHARTLRELMRAVVVEGTGTALGDVPGEASGKSGTAEFGTGDPPATRAWFIAFRGDLAVAVLVERGRSGGSVAAPIAARFLSAAGS